MIDEILHYLLKADAKKIGSTTMATMALSFLMELSSAVVSTKNAKFLYTVSENKQIYADQMSKIQTMDQYTVESMINKFHGAMSRHAMSITPVDPHDIFDVVRTRLVPKIDPNAREEIVSAYLKYYDEQGLSEDSTLRNQMLSAYPFHPLLLKEILYERVSTIPDFNRTRGILRLMSLVSHNILKTKAPCTIIGPGDVNLERSSILDELTSKLDLASYRPIISSDCVEKARSLDRNYSSFSLITSISRIIYLYSLIGAVDKSGVSASTIKMALGHPGFDPGIVDDGLIKILEHFWYINDSNGYRFDKEPNLNKVIAEHEPSILLSDIHNRIKKSLVRIFSYNSGKTNVIVWENCVEECDRLTVIISKPIVHSKKIEDVTNDILGFLPSGAARTNKNTLVFLYPDPDIIKNAESSARRLLAIEKTQKYSSIPYDKEQNKKITSKKSDAEGNLEADCKRTYNILAYPSVDVQNSPIIRLSTIMPTQIKSDPITSIFQQLKDDGKLITNLGKDGIKLSEPLTPQQIIKRFKIDRTTKMLAEPSSVLSAAVAAIKDGLFYPAKTLTKQGNKYIVDPKTPVGMDTFLVPHKDSLIQEICIKCGNPIGSNTGNVCPNCLNKDNPQCSQCGSSENIHVYSDVYYCGKCKPDTFSYQILCNTTKITSAVIQSLILITVDGGVFYHITSKLKTEKSVLTLDSSLDNLKEIRDLFQTLPTEFDGLTTIILTSDTDLSAKLINAGIDYEDMRS